MTFPASKRVRAMIGVAMTAVGALHYWGVWDAFKLGVEPYAVLALIFLSWGAGWAVLAAWAWRGARAAQGWRRAVGAVVTAVLVLATLVSFASLVRGAAATIEWGDWPALDDYLAVICPGLLVGGLWLLSGLLPKRRAPSAGGQG